MAQAQMYWIAVLFKIVKQKKGIITKLKLNSKTEKCEQKTNKWREK